MEGRDILQRLFVGGGQQYYGSTAQRDADVIKALATELCRTHGDKLEIVTGGMPGIPDDFAAAWWAAGGRRVLCVVSSEHRIAWEERALPYQCMVVGQTQEQRRLAVTRLEGLVCAFFAQGGQYSTHEMQLLGDRGVPIVAFRGSGGAAAGEQPYKGWVYSSTQSGDASDSTDPHTPAEDCAKAILCRLLSII